jgi:hypothetical protein
MIEHIPGLATAIPRRSVFGFLIFNHAFFIGKKDSPGIEVTIFSKRHEQGMHDKITWFMVKNCGMHG